MTYHIYHTPGVSLTGYLYTMGESVILQETNSFFLTVNVSNHPASKALAQPCSFSSPFSFLWRLVPTLQPGVFFMSLKNMASDRGLEKYISSEASDQLVACH